MITYPGYDLDEVRQAFPITRHLTYLNYASISPIPLPARQAMDTVADLLTSDPTSLYEPGSPWDDIRGTFPTEVAGLINAAHPEEVVGVVSTSAGLNAIAQAIDWQPGDNIIFTDVEFPSNAYPWMVLDRRHPVECRLAPPDCGGASVEGLEPLVNRHTRLIAVSAVQFLTGHRTDLRGLGAFCRERGILFAVDAIQAAGHIPIDVQAMQIDILAAGGQKSLMGLPGQGFLYVRDEVCERMRPGYIGPNATADYEHWLHYDLTPREGALRFMMGTPNLVGMVVLIESIRFLRRLGLPDIDAWTRHLSQIALEDLAGRGYNVITPTDPARLGPIVTFRVGDPDDLQAADAQAVAMLDYLRANRIRIAKHWDARGLPHLRISSHCYNTEDEVRRVGAVLEDFKP
ncbi:MAG TPA: aminotransferase class V-fold PLP-dependent enzyme [Aggregatilineales bacterium]|nr:aminotransferase class V-fold PLP-dependent enzyme [Aggregatilineales bacterium]